MIRYYNPKPEYHIETKEEKKKKQMLSDICKECGRYRRAPMHYCDKCIEEMENSGVF